MQWSNGTSCVGLIALIVVLGMVNVFGQYNAPIDTTLIYAKVRRVAPSVTQTPEQLAIYLTKDYTNDAQKVLAISYWIVRNVRYDYASYKKRRFIQRSLSEILQKRKALCEDYARLFQAMCAAVSIKADVVRGYTQGFDFFKEDNLYRAEHVWSIVQIDERWHLMDFTYASGHVTTKKQPLKRFWAQLFKTPYRPAYRYVHAFNPDWFYIAPDDLIFTHFPILDMHQLLKEPVSIKTYMDGSWAIYSHLAWHFKTLKQSEEIDAYFEKSAVEKWLYAAEEGRKNNPANHRVTGIHYYWALDSLFKASFDAKTETLKLSNTELRQLRSYAMVADSMLRQSIVDNQKEFQTKQQRSLLWQERLFSANEQHKTGLIQRKKNNQNQEVLSQQIADSNAHYQSFATEGKQRYKEATIFKIKRPSTTNLTNPQEVVAWLKRLDSLQHLSIALLQQKDTLWAAQDWENSSLKDKETLVLTIHKSNAQALRKKLKQKQQTAALVYEDMEMLDKNWLARSIGRADSLNEMMTHQFLVDLYKKHRQTYALMCQYEGAIAQQLRLLEQMKRHSAEDFKEEVRYINALSDVVVEMETYQKGLKDAMGFQRTLLKLLRKEIRYMDATARELKADNRLEKQRHQAYQDYRNWIKNTENQRMEIALARLSEIKNYLNQTESLSKEK